MSNLRQVGNLRIVEKYTIFCKRINHISDIKTIDTFGMFRRVKKSFKSLMCPAYF